MQIRFKGSSYPELNRLFQMGQTYAYKEFARTFYKFQRQKERLRGICEFEVIDESKNIHREFYYQLEKDTSIPMTILQSIKDMDGNEQQYINELTLLNEMNQVDIEIHDELKAEEDKQLLTQVVFENLEPKENKVEPSVEVPKKKRMNHYQRQQLLAEMKKKDVLSVAETLGMELRKNGRSYKWELHDSFVFDTRKNTFFWNSRGVGGDCINLVQLIKECSFMEALEFLKTGEFKEHTVVEQKKGFHYYLKDHDTIQQVKDYLVNERKLSPETVDYFYQKGMIAQADYKNPDTGQVETVLVFKNKDREGKIKGVAIQGITKHVENPHRPYLKRTLGDGYFGTNITIGNPPITSSERSSERPLTFIAFEAPIDLMSYYEIFKDKMGDCVLIAMNGLRKESISTAFSQIVYPEADNETLRINALNHVQKHLSETDRFKIILAVDNDEAGLRFVEEFDLNKFPVKAHLPQLKPGETKSDWNQILQQAKQPMRNAFHERVAKTVENTHYERQYVSEHVGKQL